MFSFFFSEKSKIYKLDAGKNDLRFEFAKLKEKKNLPMINKIDNNRESRRRHKYFSSTKFFIAFVESPQKSKF